MECNIKIRESSIELLKDQVIVYCAIKDAKAGDWLVVDVPGCGMRIHEYVLSKDDAVTLMMEQAGVIDDGNYDNAPDRTST